MRRRRPQRRPRGPIGFVLVEDFQKFFEEDPEWWGFWQKLADDLLEKQVQVLSIDRHPEDWPFLDSMDRIPIRVHVNVLVAGHPLKAGLTFEQNQVELSIKHPTLQTLLLEDICLQLKGLAHSGQLREDRQ